MKSKNTKLPTSCDIFQQAAFHTSLKGFPSMGVRASLFDTGKNGTIFNCALFSNDLEYWHKNSTSQDLDELQRFGLCYMYVSYIRTKTK